MSPVTLTHETVGAGAPLRTRSAHDDMCDVMWEHYSDTAVTSDNEAWLVSHLWQVDTCTHGKQDVTQSGVRQVDNEDEALVFKYTIFISTHIKNQQKLVINDQSYH